jgi:hypothetical protein
MTSTSRKSISNQGIGHYSFDSKYKTFKGKLTTRWLGPYEVETVFDNGVVKIKTIDDSQNSFRSEWTPIESVQQAFVKRRFLTGSG